MKKVDESIVKAIPEENDDHIFPIFGYAWFNEGFFFNDENGSQICIDTTTCKEATFFRSDIPINDFWCSCLLQ